MMKVYDVMQSFTVNSTVCKISPLIYGSQDTVYFSIVRKSVKPNSWIALYCVVLQCHLAVGRLNMKLPLILIFCRTPMKVVHRKETLVTRKPGVKLDFTPVNKSHDTLVHRIIH